MFIFRSRVMNTIFKKQNVPKKKNCKSRPNEYLTIFLNILKRDLFENFFSRQTKLEFLDMKRFLDTLTISFQNVRKG